MNRDRKRPSRFDDNRSSMNKNSRSDFGYNPNDVFSSRDMGPSISQRMQSKTTEQLAFVS
jgi:hypothetical protein